MPDERPQRRPTWVVDRLRRLRAILGSARRRWAARRQNGNRPREPAKVHAPGADPARHIDRERIDTLSAYRDNLDTALRALRATNHWLVPDEAGKRPVLAVQRSDVPRVIEHLRQLGAQEAAYVRYEGDKTGTCMAAQLTESISAGVSLLRVFHHYRDSSTGRQYGLAFSCDIEVWDSGHDGVLRSAKSLSAHTSVASSGTAPTASLDCYGRALPTYAEWARPSVFDITFPVDAVFLWVDGSDPDWQVRRDARARSADSMGEATYVRRFRQFDELRYALRSVERYAPWIRRIFLVTDGHRPAWLDAGGTNLEVVAHKQFMDPDALPTFNSHAITASLHRIDGLSDRFILFNDDFFLGRPTSPRAFFVGNGTTRFFPSKTEISTCPQMAHEHARVNTQSMVADLTGRHVTKVLRHAPYALNRQLLADLATECGVEWSRTCRSPFRSSTDLVPELLHDYVGFARQLAEPATISYRYLGTRDPALTEKLATIARGNPPVVLCINDNEAGEVPESRQRALRQFLDHHYPTPSAYEGGD